MSQQVESADTQSLRLDEIRDASTAESDQRRQFVRRATVRYLYDHAKSGFLATIGVGCILIWVLRDTVSAVSLWGWFTLLCVISVSRAIIVAGYFRQPERERREDFWRLLFIIGAAFGGVAWGLAAIIFAPQTHLEYQLLVYFMIGGMAMGGVPLLAPVLPAYLAFTVPALLSPAVWLFIHGTQTDLAIAALFVVYGAAMTGIAIQYRKSTVQSLNLEFENSALVKRVSRARDTAEDLNRQKEQEIRERTDIEAALRKSETRFRSAFDNAPIAMALVDPDGRIFQVNRTFETMLGYAAGTLAGVNFREITQPDDIEESVKRYRALCAGEVDRYQLKKRYLHQDGRTIWGKLDVSAVRDSAGTPVYCIAQIQDVTESHALSEELSYQASHDALTGLVNRREFERRLEQALHSARVNDYDHALCYMDLDQFKVINDTCGHVAGDALLRQLGGGLKSRLRRSDTIARLGGDEFGILIERCSMLEGRRVAESSLDAIKSHRFMWEGKTFSVGASIGLVPITGTEDSVTELLRLADSACYAAKDQGRNRIHVYEPGDVAVARRRGEMQWISRIHNALRENGLRLVCQPIVPVSEKADGGYYGELLLRMVDEHDRTRSHSPGAFLAAAERYDIASRIDHWVIGSAFDWLEQHVNELESIRMLSVNLSGQSLSDGELLGYVSERLSNGPIRPEKICFELTETAAIANLPEASRFFEALRGFGCRFALDDFGSGLSSFAYLKTLPVDFLKIDGVFIRDIARDPISRSMVQSINDIGKVMGKKTIAEFVESEAIFHVLRDLGVDYAQGYWIGTPRPLAELETGSLSGGPGQAPA
ncbi:MAG: EAL domain-containing protein [Gammaproteobacteria bacterium]|nr:EAL domain-containing protein [Gammaproteobacteria bacterium]